MPTPITTSNRFSIFAEKTAAQIHELATAAERRSAQILREKIQNLNIRRTVAEPRFMTSEERPKGDGITTPNNSLRSSFAAK